MDPDSWLNSQFFSQLPPSLPRQILGFVSDLGQGDALGLFCILIALYGYFAGSRKVMRSSAAGMATLLAVLPIVQTLKLLIGRARPSLGMGDMRFVGPSLLTHQYDAFPSGHSMAVFAFAAFFSSYYPRYRWLLYAGASIVSFSRVLLGQHFLTDCIVGGILGILLAIVAAVKFKKWIQSPEVERSPALQTPLVAPAMEPVEKRNWLADMLLIVAISSVALLPGLTSAALWDRDETLYAQVVVEMNQNREWIIPTIEGKPFMDKPILLYWVTRLSTLAFGQSDFSLRLPSAVIGILTCLLVYLLGCALWDRRTGLLSALILATSFFFAGAFRLLLTDPLLTFFTLLALLFYVYSLKNEVRSKQFLLLSYSAMGMAFLAKGPIGLFPGVVFLFFEYFAQGKSWRLFLSQNLLTHAMYVAIPLLIAAPWFVYLFSQHSQATETFFLHDNLSKLFKAAQGHKGPALYYVPVFLLGFLPWSVFLIHAAIKEWKDRVNQNGTMEWRTRLLSIWAIFLFVFFSLTATKLPHYVIPAFPALACLTGKFWADLAKSPVSLKASFAFTLNIMGLFVLSPISVYFIRPQYASLTLLVPFLILCVFLLLGYRYSQQEKMQQSFGAIVLGTAVAFTLLFSFTLRWVDEHRVMAPIGRAIKKNVPETANLFGYRISEPSLLYYGGRSVRQVHVPIDTLLNDPAPTYIVTRDVYLKDAKAPYKVIESRRGFSENGGEMTLVLIRNDHLRE